MCIYACALCGYEYIEDQGDEAGGIAAGVEFEDIPNDWVCPVCGAAKEEFEPIYPEED